MPEISRFLGIIIYMYGYDHAAPHFHFVYGEYEGIVYIETGVVEGEAPSKVVNRILKWQSLHKDEPMRCWELGQAGRGLFKIEPLS